MSGNADGGAGRDPRPAPEPTGAERMTDAAVAAIRDKRARRALGIRFSDGHVSGVEPIPTYHHIGEWQLESRRR